MAAGYAKDAAVVQLFINAGANLYYRTASRKQTALDIARHLKLDDIVAVLSQQKQIVIVLPCSSCTMWRFGKSRSFIRKP